MEFKNIQVVTNDSIVGNDIQMNSNMLQNISTYFDQKQLTWPNPIIFQIKTPNNIITHCGIRDFGETQINTIAMSQWLYQHLELQQDTQISIKLMNPPKMTYLKLKPLHYHFLSIKDPKSTLENVLSKHYKVLTEGDIIQVNHMNKNHQLKVQEISPKTNTPRVGCLINTQVDLEFDECDQKQPLTESFTLTKHNNFQESWTVNVQPQQFVYASVPIPTNHNMIHFILKNATTCALFVSDTDAFPSHKAYGWRHAKEITITRASGRYYISIYNINNTQQQTVTLNISTQNTKSTTPMQIEENTNNNNTSICTNCNRQIPKQSIIMHEIQCKRNNKICQLCQTLVLTQQYQKHFEQFHKEVQCSLCHNNMEAQYLPNHRKRRCAFRRAKCKWCQVEMTMINKRKHQKTCGNRTVPCLQCGQHVPLCRVNVHLAAEHNVNPSTQEGYELLQKNISQ